MIVEFIQTCNMKSRCHLQKQDLAVTKHTKSSQNPSRQSRQALSVLWAPDQWHNYLLSVLYMAELSSQRNGPLARKTDPVVSAHFLLASAMDVECVNTPVYSGPCQMVMRHTAVEIIQLSPRAMRPDCLSSLLCSQIQTYACKQKDRRSVQLAKSWDIFQCLCFLGKPEHITQIPPLYSFKLAKGTPVPHLVIWKLNISICTPPFPSSPTPASLSGKTLRYIYGSQILSRPSFGADLIPGNEKWSHVLGESVAFAVRIGVGERGENRS